MVRSKIATDYREAVQEIASASGQTMTDGCVAVFMVLRPIKPKDWRRRFDRDKNSVMSVRRMDIDNCQKVVLDSLQGVCYADDRQIIHVSTSLGLPIEGGGIEVKVVNLPEYIDISRVINEISFV